MGRKVTPPPHLRATLQRVFGAGVDAVEIVEHSWWVRLHGRAQATTRRRRIYLRGSASDFFEDPVLLLHEYCHVLHQWEPRRLSVWRYLLEWFRRGYWDNRFEVEAREFTADNLHRFRALLSQNRLPVVEPAGHPGERQA